MKTFSWNILGFIVIVIIDRHVETDEWPGDMHHKIEAETA